MHGPSETRGTVQGPPPAPSDMTMEKLLTPTGERFPYVYYGSVAVRSGLREQFETAQRYLANSPEAINSLHDLRSADKTLYIDKGDRDFHDPQGNRIYWNPNSAQVLTDGSVQTAASGLLHEQGHANEFKRDPEHYYQQISKVDAHYGNAEERRNITWEAKYSHELGEGIRNDHRGLPFPAAGPTGREPAGVKVITDPAQQRETIEARVEGLIKHGYPPLPQPGQGEDAITKWDGKPHSGPVVHLNAATVAQYVSDGKGGGAYQIYDVKEDLKGKFPPMNHPHLTIDHEGKFPNPTPTRETAGHNL
jgi:hypothetical protein